MSLCTLATLQGLSNTSTLLGPDGSPFSVTLTGAKSLILISAALIAALGHDYQESR